MRSAIKRAGTQNPVSARIISPFDGLYDFWKLNLTDALLGDFTELQAAKYDIGLPLAD